MKIVLVGDRYAYAESCSTRVSTKELHYRCVEKIAVIERVREAALLKAKENRI